MSRIFGLLGFLCTVHLALLETNHKHHGKTYDDVFRSILQKSRNRRNSSLSKLDILLLEKEKQVKLLAEAAESAYDRWLCGKNVRETGPQEECFIDACRTKFPNPICSQKSAFGGCSGNKGRMLDMGHSVIRNAFDKRQRNLKVQEEIDGVIAWTAGLHTVWVENEKSDTTSFQYIGTPSGTFRLFPAVAQENCFSYDTRLRPWYIAAIASEKHVIVVVDRSGSMQENNRFKLAKEACKTALSSLTLADHVAVVAFDDRASQVCGYGIGGGGCIAWRQTDGCRADGARQNIYDKPCNAPIESAMSGYCECANGEKRRISDCGHATFTCADVCGSEVEIPCGQTVRATKENIAVLKVLIDGLESQGLSNMTAGIEFASEMLQNQPQPCDQVILYFTDGIASPDTENNMTTILNILRKQSPMPILFSFSIGEDSGKVFPHFLACETGGLWTKINNNDDLRGQLSRLDEYFSAKRDSVTWVEPYVGSATKALMTTASIAVWDKQTPPTLIGVVGVDLLLAAINNAAEESNSTLLTEFAQRSAYCKGARMSECELQHIRLGGSQRDFTDHNFELCESDTMQCPSREAKCRTEQTNITLAKVCPEIRKSYFEESCGINCSSSGSGFLSVTWPEDIFPVGIVDKPYEMRSPDGPNEIIYTVSSGLPAGMALDESGRLHGTPRQAGQYIISIVARNVSNGQNALVNGRGLNLTIKNPPQFSTSPQWDPFKMMTQDILDAYFLDTPYYIPRPSLNKSELFVYPAQDLIDAISYKLDNQGKSPGTFLVDTDTGDMLFNPENEGEYTMSLKGVDIRGVETTVRQWTFVVEAKPNFNVSFLWDASSLGVQQGFVPIIALNQTYQMEGPAMGKDTLFINAAGAVDNIVFSLRFYQKSKDKASRERTGPPGRWLIDSETGAILGVPSKTGSYTAELIARDEAGASVVLKDWDFEAKIRDIDVPDFGPNGMKCEHGATLDEIPYNGEFTCDCEGTEYTGSNCQNKEKDRTVVIIAASLATSAILFCLAIVALLVVRRAMQATPVSKEEWEKMARQGWSDEQNIHSLHAPKEIPRELVKVYEILGQGEFGEVLKGELLSHQVGLQALQKGLLDLQSLQHTLRKQHSTPIAIKTLKLAKGISEKEIVLARLKFLEEAAIMAQFDHANVMGLKGVVTKGEPMLLVMELCQLGSLKSVLHSARPGGLSGTFTALTMTARYRISLDVAMGMEYLHALAFVHRDLAARNVLLTSHYVSKVADFGLTRKQNLSSRNENESYYMSSGKGLIPLRWTSPEALVTGKYSDASDVWSFGILCYEIFTYAETPYKGINQQNLTSLLAKGYRQPRPEGCPEDFFDTIVLPCWEHSPQDRPSFSDLVSNLTHLAGPSRLDQFRMSGTRRKWTAKEHTSHSNKIALDELLKKHPNFWIATPGMSDDDSLSIVKQLKAKLEARNAFVWTDIDCKLAGGKPSEIQSVVFPRGVRLIVVCAKIPDDNMVFECDKLARLVESEIVLLHIIHDDKQQVLQRFKGKHVKASVSLNPLFTLETVENVMNTLELKTEATSEFQDFFDGKSFSYVLLEFDTSEKLDGSYALNPLVVSDICQLLTENNYVVCCDVHGVLSMLPTIRELVVKHADLRITLKEKQGKDEKMDSNQIYVVLTEPKETKSESECIHYSPTKKHSKTCTQNLLRTVASRGAVKVSRWSQSSSDLKLSPAWFQELFQFPASKFGYPANYSQLRRLLCGIAEDYARKALQDNNYGIARKSTDMSANLKSGVKRNMYEYMESSA
eukprot:m.141424 g.141424  ORF g.141424 m.141424 type:complete len:1767 (+) comp14850_c0_seq6:155-5455(+)